MRIWNIVPEKRQFPWGNMDVVALGEEGRGRKLVLIPFHARYEPQANDYNISITRSGKPKIIRTGKPSKGWLAHINTEGVYTRNTTGYAMVLRNHVKNVEIVAVGYGAYGIAGRIGGWADYLIKVMPNTLIRVKKSGGYKTPAFYLYFSENEVYKFKEEDVSIFEEEFKITIPPLNSDGNLFSKGIENWVELDPELIEKLKKYEETKNITAKELWEIMKRKREEDKKAYRVITYPTPIENYVPEWRELPEMPKALKELVELELVEIREKEYMGNGFYRYWITPNWWKEKYIKF